MSLYFPLLVSTVLAVILQFLLWRYAVRTTNAGWVDLGWTSGMALGALVLLCFPPYSPRSLLVGMVVLFWALRLASHIYFDRLRGSPAEDGRYVALRAHWGDKANARFFWFFQAQALLVPLFLIPPAITMGRTGSFPDVFDFLGLVLALGAIAGESFSDRQLARFRKNPVNKGKVCRVGLWRYTRHPNYFFEWLHWTSYLVWALGAEGYVLTWLGAVLMYLFLRYFTGIPHTERQALKSRGDAYRHYQQTTSIFFPWTTRKPS